MAAAFKYVIRLHHEQGVSTMIVNRDTWKAAQEYLKVKGIKHSHIISKVRVKN